MTSDALLSHKLKAPVIPECLCRESSDFTGSNATGSPAQAFGDDEFTDCQFHVSFNGAHIYSLICQPCRQCFKKLTGQQCLRPAVGSLALNFKGRALVFNI